MSDLSRPSRLRESMRNDSIDTLLLRHYGSTAPAPTGLEERLHASIRREAAEMRRQQHAATHLRAQHIGRRRAIRLVALGAAGAGALSIALESLQMLEAGLLGQDVTQTAT